MLLTNGYRGKHNKMKIILYEKIIIYGLLLFWTFICLFPIYWTLTTSFKNAIIQAKKLSDLNLIKKITAYFEKTTELSK